MDNEKIKQLILDSRTNTQYRSLCGLIYSLSIFSFLLIAFLKAIIASPAGGAVYIFFILNPFGILILYGIIRSAHDFLARRKSYYIEGTVCEAQDIGSKIVKYSASIYSKTHFTVFMRHVNLIPNQAWELDNQNNLQQLKKIPNMINKNILSQRAFEIMRSDPNVSVIVNLYDETFYAIKNSKYTGFILLDSKPGKVAYLFLFLIVGFFLILDIKLLLTPMTF
jgi:hypothetical protein